MTMTTRRATQEDLDWLMAQLVDFDAFAGFKHSLIGDRGQAFAALKQLVTDHVVFIAEIGDEVKVRAGFIAGYKSLHPYNTKLRVLTEAFWWVEPKHRKSRAGLLLLTAFTDHGSESCDWTIMTLEHNSPVSERCLLKRGYVARERSFVKEA